MSSSANSESLLKVENISHAFHHKKVLRNVSFELREGELIVLLGPNGAGKTTLMKILSGLLHPTQGKVIWHSEQDGKNIYLASGFLYNELTLKENLEFYQNLYGETKEHEEQVAHALAVEDFLNDKVGELSHGQKVRGGLCRTLMMDSQLYMLDEPFSGLDDESSLRLLDVLKNFKEKNKAVVLITHDPKRVEQIASRWIQLKAGQVVWDKAQRPGSYS